LTVKSTPGSTQVNPGVDDSGLACAYGERCEAKASVRGGWRTRLTGVSVIAVFVIADAFRGGGLPVHSAILAVLGAVLFVGGIALAVWARLHLGRNWGMPMTQRAEPELVTSGPYDGARQQPARPDRRRGAARVLLLLRDGRGAQSRADLPRRLPGVPRPDEGAHPYLL
jgi:hypothetical protein